MQNADEITEQVYARMIAHCVKRAREEWRWYLRDLRLIGRRLGAGTGEFAHLAFLRKRALGYMENARKLQEARATERAGGTPSW
jgi:hypothetical protein